jgi:hypothetical protein
MNALYLKDLAHKTRRGLRGRVESGRSGGGLCYGYDVVRETAPDGATMPGRRGINDGAGLVAARTPRSAPISSAAPPHGTRERARTASVSGTR